MVSRATEAAPAPARSGAIGAPLPLGSPARPAGAVARLLERLAGESLLVVSGAAFAVALVLRLSGQVNQDAWLAFLSGRAIVDGGLPQHDAFTIWGAGKEWVDQQWLAHLGLYGLAAAGGVALAAFVHALLTIGAFSGAMVAARARGASPRSLLYVLPFAFWILIGSTWQVRTQSFAYPLFVALVILLASDSRRPSARVFLVLPLLALWANLHGSAALGAGLVCLYGLTGLVSALRRRARRGMLRPAVLACLAPASLLANPYGLSVLGYYHETLFNPAFSSMLNEWQPPPLGVLTAPFFVLALATGWLIGRCRGCLTPFEQLALLAMLGSGFLAERNAGWFALTALVLLPQTIDRARPARRDEALPGRFHGAVALGAVGVLVCLLGVTLARSDGWFTEPYPPGAADAVARAVAAKPGSRVFADVRYADWLLWQHPELAGRIAYDARFELLSTERIRQIYTFYDRYGDPWRVATEGFPLVVVDSRAGTAPVAGLRRGGARILYRGHGAVVIAR